MSAPNLKEIEWAISELEGQESSEGRYTLLAALYTCQDHLTGAALQDTHIAAYSEAPPPVEERIAQYGDSDFLKAVSGKPPDAAWAVMDELMETLRVINVRAYEGVMRKMDRL